jgi:hypothetical protein
MSRNVVVASPAANQAKRITTDAKTWGELKSQSEVAALISGEVDAIVNPGRLTLGSDESVLPEGDFNLYLITKKNKAGMADYSGIGVAIEAAIVKAASLASDEEVEELKDSLIEVIADHFDVSIYDLEEEPSNNDNGYDEDLAAALEEARNMQ